MKLSSKRSLRLNYNENVPSLYAPLCGNRTLSSKPKLYNIQHFCQRRTEQWLHVTCTQNLQKFRHVIFQTCKQTDRHTDMLTAILHTAIGGKVTNVVPPVPGWTRWHPRLLQRHCPGRQSQIWWPEIYHRVPGTVSYQNRQSADAVSDQPTETTHLAKYQRDGRQWCSNWLTDWVVVLRPTWHKIGHFFRRR